MSSSRRRDRRSRPDARRRVRSVPPSRVRSGKLVFVTGFVRNCCGGFRSHRRDYLTWAYKAATGGHRWFGRYNGPASGYDMASSVAVSRARGGTVVVTGRSHGATSGQDYATVAYSAATGAQRWVRRYNGPGNGKDEAFAVTASPDGGTVYVTGASRGRRSGLDYATIAYKG